MHSNIYSHNSYNTSDNGVCSNNNETCNSTSPMYFQPILNPEIPLWSTILLGFLGFFHAVLAVLVVIEYYARNWGHLVDICKNMRYKCCVGLHYIDCCHSYRHRVLASNKYFDESFQPFYLFIFMLCSVVAWIPYPTTLKYFYCVCLLYPFLRRSVMLYILRALKRSCKTIKYCSNYYILYSQTASNNLSTVLCYYVHLCCHQFCSFKQLLH